MGRRLGHPALLVACGTLVSHLDQNHVATAQSLVSRCTAVNAAHKLCGLIYCVCWGPGFLRCLNAGTITTLRTVDIGGQLDYLHPHRVCKSALYLVCCSIEAGRSKSSMRSIAQISKLLSAAPQAYVVVVATKADVGEAASVFEDSLAQLRASLQQADQRRVHSEVLPTSALTGAGLKELMAVVAAAIPSHPVKPITEQLAQALRSKARDLLRAGELPAVMEFKAVANEILAHKEPAVKLSASESKDVEAHLRDLLVITTVGAVVVLDPEWLAGVVSSLQGHTTYHPVPNPNQLHTTDWDRVWRQYPARMRPTLLTLLHGMDMVFKACDVARGAGAPHHLDSHGYSIVPAMLPTTACGGDCVERFDTIAGHGTTKLPAASIHVTMDHIPHYFFARFHACVQALVSPHDSHLWRNGGIYTAHAAAAGLARKVMVWQPALEKPTIKVLLHCTNMGTSAVQFQLSFVHCLHHRLSSLAHAHTNFCLRCFAVWRLWLRVFSARPLPTLLLHVLGVTAPECHSA